MVDYIYKAKIWTDTSTVIGVDPAVEAANLADFDDNDDEQRKGVADFDANYRASTIPVGTLEVLATAFTTEWNYDTLKAHVDDVALSWTDIKLITGDIFVDLIVISQVAL